MDLYNEMLTMMLLNRYAQKRENHHTPEMWYPLRAQIGRLFIRLGKSLTGPEQAPVPRHKAA
jgi:hypothetical protein